MVDYKELYAKLFGTLSKICDLTKASESFLDAEIYNLAYIAMNNCEQEILNNEIVLE